MQQRPEENMEQRVDIVRDPIIEVINPRIYDNSGGDGSRTPFSGIWSRKLRVKITGRDGFERLDVRILVSSRDTLLCRFLRSLLIMLCIFFLVFGRPHIVCNIKLQLTRFKFSCRLDSWMESQT